MAQPPPQIGFPYGTVPPPTGFDPLVVEVDNPLGGGPRVRGWLGADLAVHWPVNDVKTAELEVVLYNGWLVNDGTPDNPAEGRIDELLPDDALVTVRTDRSNPAENFVLFRGFVEKLEYSAAGSKTARIQLRHLFQIAGERLEDMLIGQLRFSQSETISLAAGNTDVLPSHYTGLPCVLNPDSKRNCRPNAITLEEVDILGRVRQRPLSVFTSEHDPNVQSWTWARWFLYLLYWPRRTGSGFQWLDWTEHRFVDLNLADLIVDRSSHLIDPDEGGDPPTHPWDRVMWAKPVNHAVDGMTWLEALDWSCARSGVGYHVEDFYDMNGTLRTGLRFFVPGADIARRKWFYLPSQAYTTHDKDWEDVRLDANVTKMTIVSDRSQITNAVYPLGGVNRHEVTIPLVPMWEPDLTYWDVDPSDQNAVQQMLGRVGSAEWLSRFTREGSQNTTWFTSGRLWGIPDTDQFIAALARPWLPWDEDVYERFDLATLGVGELLDPSGQPLVGRGAVRERVLRPLLSSTGYNNPLSPVVQMSLDSGATWLTANGGVQIARNTLRIMLDIPDPRNITAPSGDDYVRAYIEGRLRMRITGVIEADQAVAGPLAISPDSLSRRQRVRTLNRRATMLRHLRDDSNGFGGGNSFLKNNGRYPPLQKKPDGWDEHASRVLNRADRVRHKGVVVIPEIVYPHEVGSVRHGYRPGDEIEAIVAEEGQSIHDIPLAARMDEDYVIIAGVTWRYAVTANRAVFHTECRLEDPSSLVAFGGERSGA